MSAAPAADVSGYLGGVRRTVVDDLGSTFGTTGISQVDGGASAGVRVTGTVGATVPVLGGLAWGLLLTGALVVVIGVLLTVLAARRGSRRSGPPAAYQPAGAAGEEVRH